MSWDISLLDATNTPVDVERHEEGGTYVMGDTPTAELNITYNYSSHYYRALNAEEGLRWLNDKRAGDVLPQIETAVGLLGTEQDKNYWKATEGNAGHALAILARWARQYPDAVFSVT